MVNGSSRVEHISNVNFLWKVMRVRNGIGPKPPS
jgi:hypothetical protein